MTTPRYIYDHEQEDHRLAQTDPRALCNPLSGLSLSLKRELLWDLCERFIKQHDISCEETIYQTDDINEAALELVEKIAELIGYVKEVDETATG